MIGPTPEPIRRRDCSFTDFHLGTLGNAGQNLYVSRAGVLQRITHTSLTGSGYVDIPFANSHDDAVRVPAYLYPDPLSDDRVIEIETDGAFAGAVSDLNDDGFDDLVIANQYDGATNEVYAQVYFGSAEGFSRRRMLQLWAPSSKDVAIGSFAPSAAKSIVFVSRERLLIFDQDEHGFGARRCRELRLPGDIESIVVADLDGDGTDDLVVRSPDSSVRIYWGGAGGLDLECCTLLDPILTGDTPINPQLDTAAMGTGDQSNYGPTGLFVYRAPTASRIKAVEFDGRSHLFLCPDSTSMLVCFDGARKPKVALAVESGPAMSAATGDIRGIGATDLVLATRQSAESGEQFSLVYWGTPCGGLMDKPDRLATRSANDVAIVDLSGDGMGDVAFCQDQVTDSYTTESLVFPASRSGLDPEPRRLRTHCALDMVFVRWPQDGLPKPVFVNHLSNSVLGDIDSYVYLGSPDGYSAERRLEFPGWAATEMKFVDFDDRGAPDVYVANSNENNLDVNHGSFVYYRDGDDFPIENRVELPTEHNMSGVVADLNRNGYLDLVTTGWGQDEIVIFEGGPDGFRAPIRVKLHIDGKVYDQPRYMSMADVDRDGWLDLIVPALGGNGGVIILWGGPEGFSNERATVLDSGTAVSTRVADLDGDGWLDLVVGGFKGEDPRHDYRTFVYIYWGGPDGYSNDHRTQLPAYFPVDVGVADLNNDGALDLVVTNYQGHQVRDLDSYIYWGSPGGHFHPTNVTRLFHHSACGVLAADFDEDGYVDLAIANHKTYGNHPGQSFIWHNGPDGFSEERRTTLPTGGPHGLSHLDIGNVYDRGAEEHFESRVFELPDGGTLAAVAWTGTVPAKTWVRAQVRSAASAADLERADWTGPQGVNTWFEESDVGAVPLERLVQYRLALGAVNSVATPRISSVELTVTPDYRT